MTADERDLTPEEAELSALLAELGGPVATPPEVVARLDDVLAGLVADRADRAGEAGTGPVSAPVSAPVSLDAARRRRRWPKALLAAAAVVAGGYGVGAALTGTTMSGDAESSVTADDAAGGAAEPSEDAGDAGGGAGGDGEARESQSRRDGVAALAEAPANASALRQGVPRLRSDRLAEGVVLLLEERGEELAGDTSTAPKRALVGAAACLPDRLGPDDDWFLVRYDGRRAALVTAPPEQGTVEATVVRCDGQQLDTVTVPAG
jgi:hypothetical protein